MQNISDVPTENGRGSEKHLEWNRALYQHKKLSLKYEVTITISEEITRELQRLQWQTLLLFETMSTFQIAIICGTVPYGRITIGLVEQKDQTKSQV